MVHKGVDKRSPKIPAHVKAKIQIRLTTEALFKVDEAAEAKQMSRNEFLEEIINDAVGN